MNFMLRQGLGRGRMSVSEAYRRWCWLLLALALLLPGLAFAAEQVGVVVVARGSVQAIADGEAPRELRRRSPLFVGDTVRTGADGSAQLRFNDGELLELRADTELKIDQHTFSGVDKPGNNAVKTLIKGGFRAITGAVGGDRYRVDTPAATIGIRGTHYELFSPTGSDLYVAVWRGGVTVANAAGRLELGVGAGYNVAYVKDAASAPQGLLQTPDVFMDSVAPAAAPRDGAEAGSAGGGAPRSVEDFAGRADGDDAAGSDGTVFGGSGLNGPGDIAGYLDPQLPIELPAPTLEPTAGLAVTGTAVFQGGIGGYAPGAPVIDDAVNGSLSQGSAPLGERYNDSQLRVEWGVWNADSTNPASLEYGGVSNPVSDPVYWVAGETTDPAVVAAQTGSASYGSLVGFLGESGLTGPISLGTNSEACDISLEVNFGTGSFSGSMDLTVQNGSQVGLWQVGFSGSITGNAMNSDSVSGIYTQHDLVSGESGQGDVGGQVNMNFLGAGADGVAGAYYLYVIPGSETGPLSVAGQATSGVFVLRR